MADQKVDVASVIRTASFLLIAQQEKLVERLEEEGILEAKHIEDMMWGILDEILRNLFGGMLRDYLSIFEKLEVERIIKEAIRERYD
ncbi:hypothetical protein ACFL06_01295 [Patescibacteria group bacterium]